MDGIFVIVGILFLSSIVSAIVFLIALAVSALIRKNVKPYAKGFGMSLLCFSLSCVIGITLGGAVPDKGGKEESADSTTEYVWETVAKPTTVTAATETETTDPTEATELKEEPIGSRGNPFIVTLEEFVSEINADIDAAKDKYNGKWVEITGRVTDYSRYNSDSLSGYYLCGEYGKEGLKIVCWQNKGADLQFLKVGLMCTCLGRVREVSTFNATEIADCQMVFEENT